jgi:adenosylcobinamide-GDP ribazoletransferase
VGAVTLLLVVATPVAALAGVLDARGGVDAAGTVALAVVVSRATLAPACSRGISAARADGLGSAVAGTVPAPVAALVVVGAALLALLVDGGRGLAGVLVAVAAGAVVLLRARRRLGGVTGDVLGAVVEVALAAYLVAQVVGLPAG